MESTIAAIELGSRQVKLVVGYELDGKVFPVYACTKPYGKLIQNANFINYQALLDSINSIKEFVDPSARINIRLQECILALPSQGLQIFHTKERAPVISERGKVSEMDIRNLFSLVKNTSKATTHTSTLVDIIPEEYILDESRLLKCNPIGDVAKTIVLSGKVHLVPDAIFQNYTELINKAEINIKREVVTPFANLTYLSTVPDMPDSYILVDIGSDISTCSLIGNGVLFGTRTFEWGGHNVTEKISNSFNISEEEAEKIKILYGFDDRQLNFHAPVATSVDIDGNKTNFFIDDLNNIIADEVNNFLAIYKSSMEDLLVNQDSSLMGLPIILVGGGSQLKDIDKYIANKLGNNQIKVVSPSVLGARDPSLMTCLGMILVASKYSSLNEESKLRVNGITRD